MRLKRPRLKLRLRLERLRLDHPRLELLRLLGVGVAFALLPDWFGFQAPVALRGAVLVFAIGSAAWLLRRSTTAQQVPA